jgi:hypothetical protein
MSGISRMIAKELSSALGIIDNPKYNPMFKQTDEALTDVADPNDPTVARFYSPLESAIDEAPIGKEGTRGENIEAFVRKRAPKVTQAEMEYRGLGLEPGELYTAESAKEGLKGLDVKAVKLPAQYYKTQRQKLAVEEELDYVELGITASNKEGGKLTGLERLDHYQKYKDSVLAHSRYSVRKGIVSGNKNYILVEEIQSDPVQNIIKDKEKYFISKKEKYQKDSVPEYINTLVADLDIELGETLSTSSIDNIVDFSKKHADIQTRKISREEKVKTTKELLKSYGIEDDYTLRMASKAVGTSPAYIIEYYAKKELSSDAYEDLVSGSNQWIIDDTIADMSEEIRELKKIELMSTEPKGTPVTKTTDYVRFLIESMILDAKQRNIDEIVFPPLDQIVAERVSRIDYEEIKKATSKGSPFYSTYVDAVNKVLKGLKAELGDQVKIGKKKIPYYDFNTSSDKLVEGTLLDISNLTIDPSNIKLRFNKGGLVERRTK